MTPIVTADVGLSNEILGFMVISSLVSGFILSFYAAYEPSLDPSANGIMMLFMFPVASFASLLSLGVMLSPIMMIVFTFSIGFPKFIIGIILVISFIMAFAAFINDVHQDPQDRYSFKVILFVPTLWVVTFFMACGYAIFSPLILFVWIGEFCQELLKYFVSSVIFG